MICRDKNHPGFNLMPFLPHQKNLSDNAHFLSDFTNYIESAAPLGIDVNRDLVGCAVRYGHMIKLHWLKVGIHFCKFLAS